MIEIRNISEQPWDYTVYEATDGSLILKVVFSEGDYKMDIGRFFKIASEHRDSDVKELESLAAAIRDDFPNVEYDQVEKSNLQIVE